MKKTVLTGILCMAWILLMPFAIAVSEPMEITIYYQDANGKNIAASQRYDCYFGANIIEAAPIGLKSGYTLNDEYFKVVYLDAKGLSAQSVTFVYAYTAVPVPTAAFAWEVEPFDGYCRPSSDTVNFRSGPSTSASRLATVNRQDVGHIFGTFKDANGDLWYAVEIDGNRGFLRQDVTRLLTDSEALAYLGHTPAPTATPVPDGMPIDLWGYTNAQVNFRSAQSKTAKALASLKKNSSVWVYCSETSDGVKWYKANVNGKTGYIMAEYVTLSSQSDSDKMQRSLSSPVPTQVPVLTPVPTAAPTTEPSPEPTLPSPVQASVPRENDSPLCAIVLWQTPLKDEAGNLSAWLSSGTEVRCGGSEAGNTYVTVLKDGMSGLVETQALKMLDGDVSGALLSQYGGRNNENTEDDGKNWENGENGENDGEDSGIVLLVTRDRVSLYSLPDTDSPENRSYERGGIISAESVFYNAQGLWYFVTDGTDWGFVSEQDTVRLTD